MGKKLTLNTNSVLQMYFIQLLSRVSGEQISRIETPALPLSLLSLSVVEGAALKTIMKKRQQIVTNQSDM